MNRRVAKNEGPSRFETQGVCPSCGRKRIRIENQDYEFPYGTAEAEAMLMARVPMMICDDCGFAFMGRAGEEACHEAICKHLGVMTPANVRNLREMHGLTQTRFAKLTGLGEATLSRWERGTVVQNQAYDNFLFLLGFEDNVKRLAERMKFSGLRASEDSRKPTFRSLAVTPDLLAREEVFELRPSCCLGR